MSSYSDEEEEEDETTAKNAKPQKPKWQVEMERDNSLRNELQAGRQAMQDKNETQFLATGFVQPDAYKLAYYYTPLANGWIKVSTWERSRIGTYYRAKIQFDSLKATASFDLLLWTANRFGRSTYTYLSAMDELEKRFPTQKEKLVLQRLLALAMESEPWELDSTRNADYLPLNAESEKVKAKAMQYFAQHYPQYRQQLLRFMGGNKGDENPLYYLARDARYRKDAAALRYYWSEMLLVPYPLTKTVLARIYEPLTELKKVPGFFSAQPPAYYREMAKLRNVVPVVMLELLSSSPLFSARTIFQNPFDGSRDLRLSARFTDESFHIPMKKLAEEGDASCANGYGIYLWMQGKTAEEKAQGLTYLNKAVVLGSIWARLNLAFLSSDNAAAGLSFADQKTALQNFADTATKTTVTNLINSLISPNVLASNDPWFFTFAHNLLLKRAAAGDSSARKYLDSEKSLFRNGSFTGEVKDMAWEGGKYTGSVKNGRPHGKGQLLVPSINESQELFPGTFWNGRKAGQFDVKRLSKKGKLLETYGRAYRDVFDEE